MEDIRVLLADDHEIILDSLAMMISSLPGIKVVTTAINGCQALEKLNHVQVDMILSDMHMPEMNGLELALELRTRWPEIRLILLTMEEEPEMIRAAAQAGVWGYVLKKASRKELERAILTVMAGERYFVEEDADHRLQKSNREDDISDTGASELIALLSKREIEIIRLIVNEVPGQEIANQLFISPKTVETHRRNIFRKLEIHSAVALTRFAIKHKII